MIRFDVVTLVPEMLEALSSGVVGQAIEQGTVVVRCWDLRRHGVGVHRSVDDRPFGGGPGMVLQYAPLAAAVREVERDAPELGRPWWVVLSPQGRRLTHAGVERLATRRRVGLVCGRYEGFDERFVEAFADEELSLGDFVLSGGELAAMAVIDACARWQPGVLGHAQSAREDSFATGLLDHPQYTRPVEIDGRRVPDVLRSGDHAAVRRWRRGQALLRTLERRPDLLAGVELSDADARLLDEARRERRPAPRSKRQDRSEDES